MDQSKGQRQSSQLNKPKPKTLAKRRSVARPPKNSGVNLQERKCCQKQQIFSKQKKNKAKHEF